MKNSHIACLIIVGIVVIVIIHAVFIIDWYADDVLDGSEFQEPVLRNERTTDLITDIVCPDGYVEGHVDSFGNDGSFEAIPVCFSTTIINPIGNPDAVLFCGDEYVSPEGMVTTVGCTISTP